MAGNALALDVTLRYKLQKSTCDNFRFKALVPTSRRSHKRVYLWANQTPALGCAIKRRISPSASHPPERFPDAFILEIHPAPAPGCGHNSFNEVQISSKETRLDAIILAMAVGNLPAHCSVSTKRQECCLYSQKFDAWWVTGIGGAVLIVQFRLIDFPTGLGLPCRLDQAALWISLQILKSRKTSKNRSSLVLGPW